jgi:poly(3-hydroxybutyrate) depolymerase
VCKVSGQSGRPGVVENRQITVNGANQTYVLYVGRGYTGTTSAAVLIAFHGYGDSASNYIQTSRWMTLADQHGFILGVPHKPASGGKSSGSWDAYSTSSSDLSFADAVSKDIQDNHNTNPKRLYAVGFSQGGYFTYLYGMTRASTLAAFGVQAASSPGLPLTASRKIAAIFVIGSLDSAYNRAQQDSQNLQKAGHPTQFIGLPNEGHCCAAQHSKNADVWSFFQNHPLP